MGSDECPGVRSERAGKENACKGCPNVSYCSKPKIVDPDVEVIKNNLKNIAKMIAIMSGKGGVGKSTFTRNVAEALVERKRNVCILDLDFSGPSIPKLTATDGQMIIESNNVIYPITVKDSLSVVSVGHFVDFDDPTVYDSNLKTQLLKKILKQCDFSNVEYLLIDTPPNITDEHLGMVTYIKPHGSIVITTPQKIAFQDVIRQIDFCKKAKINVLGVVENMKGFVCIECQTRKDVFNSYNVEDYCNANSIRYLGYLNLDINIARSSDSGVSNNNEIFIKLANILNDV